MTLLAQFEKIVGPLSFFFTKYYMPPTYHTHLFFTSQ